jgi:YVTN family beta-propeller protein
VSVVDTERNTVTATIGVGALPSGVAVTPDGSKVYVTNLDDPLTAFGNTVSVIATAKNAVIGFPITVGSAPVGVVVTQDGSKVYVANDVSNNVSVIATATNTVATTITDTSFNSPQAFGVFIIQPDFTGTPGFSNCDRQTVAALARRFRGLNAAAAALGFPNTQALQKAVRTISCATWWPSSSAGFATRR